MRKSFLNFDWSKKLTNQISRLPFFVNGAWDRMGVREHFVQIGAPYNFALDITIVHVNFK
jgi:hypothetical protein